MDTPRGNHRKTPVIDQRGELLGTGSKDKMKRNVAVLGHNPKTGPVEAHMENDNPYCFEDQMAAEAEQMMLNALSVFSPVQSLQHSLLGTFEIPHNRVFDIATPPRVVNESAKS
jgi:hypothetical protein